MLIFEETFVARNVILFFVFVLFLLLLRFVVLVGNSAYVVSNECGEENRRTRRMYFSNPQSLASSWRRLSIRFKGHHTMADGG